MRYSTSKLWLFLLPLPFFSGSMVFADAIQGLTFTEVVKDVLVIDAATKAETSPKVGDVLVAPNVLKTGADSRAELVAEDKTVTRVGSNTIFSVEVNSRDVNLAQGNVLFNAPKGKGGGRIKSAGATASVLGTTFITSASPSGGFKVMGLEGSVQVDGSKGGSSKIGAGQLSFALPGGKITPPMSFDLKAQVSGSKLVGGFAKPLASIAKIEAAINVQQAKIASGALASTGLLLGDRPDTAFKVDPSTIRSVVAQVLAQVAAEKETASPSGNVVDPRLLKAFQQKLILSSPTTSASVAPWRMQLASTDVYSAYLKNGSQSTLWILPSTDNQSYSLVSREGYAYKQVSKTVQDSNVSLLYFESLEGPASKITLKKTLSTVGSGITSSTTTSFSLLTPTSVGATTFAESLLLTQDASVAPEGSLFGFTGGKTSEGWLSPKSIPGDRIGFGTHDTFVSLLAGKDLDFSLAAVGSKPAPLHIDPVAGGLTDSTTGDLLPKDGIAILALNDMRLNGSIEFADLMNQDSGEAVPLLISVGRTLTVARGTLLRADTSLLEIYAAGTGFSADIALSELPLASGASKSSLELKQVAVVNKVQDMDATVRITAPGITIIDSAFQVLPLATKSAATNLLIGSLIFESDGNITWTTNSTKPTDFVPLGFSVEDGVDKLSADAFNVRITSTKKAVTLNGVNLAANDTRISAGLTLSLSNVVFDIPNDFAATRSVSGASITTDKKSGISTVSVPDTSTLGVGMLITGTGIPAGATIASVDSQTVATLNVPDPKLAPVTDTEEGSTVILGLPTTFISGVAVGDVSVSGVKASPVVSTYLNSTGGNVSVDNSELGSVPAQPTDRAPVTSFIAKALGSLSLMNSKICADNTELFGGADVTVSNVTIAPTESTKGTVKVKAVKDINVNSVNNPDLNKYYSVTAYQISMAAGGDLNINGKLTDAANVLTANYSDGTGNSGKLAVSGNNVTGNKFSASAGNNMVVNRVDFGAVQNVALDATTLVIRNTQFGDGSTVALNSQLGKLAGNPGTGAGITRGMVNVVSGVYYGATEFKLPSTGDMDNAAFRAAATTAGKEALKNITIGGPKTTTN
jgi:hypothetical protein